MNNGLSNKETLSNSWNDPASWNKTERYVDIFQESENQQSLFRLAKRSVRGRVFEPSSYQPLRCERTTVLENSQHPQHRILLAWQIAKPGRCIVLYLALAVLSLSECSLVLFPAFGLRESALD